MGKFKMKTEEKKELKTLKDLIFKETYTGIIESYKDRSPTTRVKYTNDKGEFSEHTFKLSTKETLSIPVLTCETIKWIRFICKGFGIKYEEIPTVKYDTESEDFIFNFQYSKRKKTEYAQGIDRGICMTLALWMYSFNLTKDDLKE